MKRTFYDTQVGHPAPPTSSEWREFLKGTAVGLLVIGLSATLALAVIAMISH